MIWCRKNLVWAYALFSTIPVVYSTADNTTCPNKGGRAHSSYCCNVLEGVLGSAVHRPYTTEYTIENTFWALQASLSPTCILTPASVGDLSTAVKILSGDHCTFAVRGGGHSPIAGWANTNDGVLISMHGFKEITVKDNYARVGAGNVWGEVYSALEQYNLTVAGGRVATVGVPGFILGGGLTFLTYEQGFACDSVKNFELVNGHGDILQVNAKSYPDLFEALKGSSSNFGIVTNFDLYTYPHNSKVYGGTYIYAEDKIPEILSAAIGLSTTGAISDTKSHIIPTFAWTKETASISAAVIVYYNGQVDSNSHPEVLKNFTDIPMVADTTKMQNTSELTTSVGYPASGLRQYHTSITITADEALLMELDTIWRQGLELLKPYAISIVLGCQPIPITAIEAGFARGGNSLGFTPDDKNLLHVFWFTSWTDVALDGKVISGTKKLVSKSISAAKKKGLLHPFQYLNYASEDQDPIASYGEESVKKLRKARKKYDPDSVFVGLVKGGFKIPKGWMN